MSLNVRITQIPLSQIVYRVDSGLFPYSPRPEILPRLVQELKRSIAETGMWSCILIKADDMSGIAGNHRFLALRELAIERGIPLDEALIPAALVDCTEGEAVVMGLIENELRFDLPRPEAIAMLLRAYTQEPVLTEAVLGVSSEAAYQMTFWGTELSPAEEAGQCRLLLKRLTREWIALINDRLKDYPDLREHFLEQLRHPRWVLVRTLEELDQAITRALREQGMRFEDGGSWNARPAPLCLRCRVEPEDLPLAVREESGLPDGRGTVKAFCPHLHLVPQYVHQFTPDPNGTDLWEASVEGQRDAIYPEGVLTEDGRHVRGRTTWLVDHVDAWCTATDVHSHGGCFRTLEAAAAQSAVDRLRQQGSPAVLPEFVEALETAGEFVWPRPRMDDRPCSPETCKHADDSPAGFVLVLRPTDRREMVCIHAECGGAARDTAAEQARQQAKLDRQRQREALGLLRQQSAARTILAPAGKAIDLTAPSLLQIMEPLLIEDWDTPTRFHVVTGWQAAECQRLQSEIGVTDSSAREVTRVFEQRYGALAEKISDANVMALYRALRERILAEDGGLVRWVTYLIVVRSWRKSIDTWEQISQMVEQVSAYA